MRRLLTRPNGMNDSVEPNKPSPDHPSPDQASSHQPASDQPASDQPTKTVQSGSATPWELSAPDLFDRRSLPAYIAGYRIRRVIASGGMGTVFEATQEQPERVVAVKVMRQGIASRSALRRFEYEAQLLGRLQHPGIARIYEAGMHETAHGAVPYFAMEYVDGAKSITRYAIDNELSLADRLKLLVKVCEALHHGHQKGIIHRDLKPGNILVDSEGRPRVIDYGVARATDSDIAQTTMHTSAGELVGTLQYMSPEQCEADPARIDTRTDVYSLGVVLFEVLTRALPYNLKNVSLLKATECIRSTAPTKLGTIDRVLRGDLETIVDKALAKEPEARYASAQELADDIRRFLNHQPIVARPPSTVYLIRKFARRNRLALAGAFVVLIAIGFAGYSYLNVVGARHAATVQAAQRLYFEAQLESQRDPDKAIAKYTEALAVTPDLLSARIDLAYLYRRLNREREAIAEAEEIIERYPEGAGPAHLLLAQLYQSRQPKLAAQHLARGSELLPDDQYYRALALPDDQAEKAIELLTTVIERDPLNYGALYARAWRHAALEQWKAMLADAELLTIRWPETGTYWNAKGIAQARLGRLDEAIESYNAFLARVPDYAPVLLNRAETYFRRHKPGDEQRALRDCDRAVEFEPTFAKAFALRAKIHDRAGRTAEASHDCEMALTYDPENSLALRVWGGLLARRGLYEQALDAYERGIGDTAQPEDYHNRARLYRRKKDYKRALADHDRAISMMPDQAIVYRGRAVTRWFAGDTDGALRDLDTCIEKDPRYAVQSLQWAWEIHRLRGQPGDEKAAADALQRAREADPNRMEALMLDVCAGTVSEDELFQKMHPGDPKTIAYYYLGARALVDGHIEDAKRLWTRCVEHTGEDLHEVILARWHLDQLAGS